MIPLHNDIRRIGDLSVDGVFLFDLVEKKFTYLNEPFAKIFSSKREKLLEQPRTVLPFIRSEDATYLEQRLDELKRNHTITNTEFRLYFDNDVTIHLCCDAYLLDNETTVAGFIKDFSKEKEHEDFIINYGARKDTLLDMITHNLSGPLNLSEHILDWMQRSYLDKVPSEISSPLQLIQENTRQCLDIVNDFLREEHMESERIYVKKTRFDVVERVRATLEKLVATNRDKQFRIITKLDNLNITTDSVKFFQIIHNLVSNAIKFTPDNGKIDVIIEDDEKRFTLRVRDNGIGIPQSIQPLLFERRTLAGRTGLKNEKSSGLGLSIAKALVELLDGDITFESKENTGTTFSVHFPKE